MDKEEREFLNFMLEHPEFYPLIKSEVMIAVLEKISKEAASEEQLLKSFKIARQDLKEILEVLKKLNLVSRLDVKGKKFHYASPVAREFLQKYKKGRKEFGVIEE